MYAQGNTVQQEGPALLFVGTWGDPVGIKRGEASQRDVVSLYVDSEPQPLRTEHPQTEQAVAATGRAWEAGRQENESVNRILSVSIVKRKAGMFIEHLLRAATTLALCVSIKFSPGPGLWAPHLTRKPEMGEDGWQQSQEGARDLSLEHRHRLVLHRKPARQRALQLREGCAGHACLSLGSGHAQ